MKRRLLVWAGALTAVVGVTWTLQGLGYVGGSAMTGEILPHRTHTCARAERSSSHWW